MIARNPTVTAKTANRGHATNCLQRVHLCAGP